MPRGTSTPRNTAQRSTITLWPLPAEIRRIPMSAVPPLLAPPEGFEGAVAAGTAKATPTDVMLRAIMVMERRF